MVFNIACVVENAFPGWSSIYASAQGAAEGGLDLVASVTDHWINRYGIYLPTYPNFDFIAWSELALYITLGLLVRLLIKSELALRSLRRAPGAREEGKGGSGACFRVRQAGSEFACEGEEPQGARFFGRLRPASPRGRYGQGGAWFAPIETSIGHRGSHFARPLACLRIRGQAWQAYAPLGEAASPPVVPRRDLYDGFLPPARGGAHV